MIRFTSIFFLASLFTISAFALEYETVVTDDSFSTSSRTVITEQEIKNSKAPNVSTLLQSQAGLSVSNTNVQPNSIYLRGGDSSHVLIMVDGVPYYDGTTTQRTINLNTIDLRTIRRIEILRGSQSVLYGGQALTGVIKIETFPLRLLQKIGLTASTGTQNSKQISAAGLIPVSENSAISLRASSFGKNATSPVAESKFRYPVLMRSFDLAHVYRGETYETLLKGFISSDISEVSSSDPAGSYLGAMDTKDYRTSTLQTGGAFTVRKNEGDWRPQFSAAYQNSDRDYDQPINEFNTSVVKEQYGGDTWNLRGELRFRPSTGFKFDGGVQYTRETLVYRSLGLEKDSVSQELRGLFTKFEWPATDFFKIEAGGRADDGGKNKVDTSDLIFTHQVGLNFWDRLKFEYATGFKTAALFQLYGQYGNSSLKPEKSKTYSITAEFPSETNLFSFTIFETSFADLIRASGFPTKYQNVSEARTKGLEMEYNQRISEIFSSRLSFGYQEPRDLTANDWLVRRPLVTGAAKLSANTGRNIYNLEVVGNGDRRDQSFRAPTRYTTLSGFVIWHASWTHVISENANVFLRGNNLFDYRFEDSAGYFNEGRTAQVGFEIFN